MSLNHAVVVLESNTGYTELHRLLVAAGDRSRVGAEDVQRALKDLVFSRWVEEACEERTDTLKMVRMPEPHTLNPEHCKGNSGGGVPRSLGCCWEALCIPSVIYIEAPESGTQTTPSTLISPPHAACLSLTAYQVGLIDFFLPFLPLERRHVRQLLDMRLRERAEEALVQEGLGGLTWDKSVLDFLASRVDFDGEYPVEGAKEVGTLITRYVSRPLREWAEAQRQGAAQQRHQQREQQGGDGDARQLEALPSGRLRVGRDGRSLAIEPAPRELSN